MKSFKCYPKPFGILDPPPAPPNRDVVAGGLFCGGETEESKERSAEYRRRLQEYEDDLDALYGR